MIPSTTPSDSVASFDSHAAFESYYDHRYESGYMDSWDEVTELKIRNFFKRLPIVSGGKWLDFGCGQGALTGLLASICPEASITGCDISPVAIKKANEQLECADFQVWNPTEVGGPFDLIFSHHVLEHVMDIEETLDQLNQITNPNALHCHILPCGNKGSLEWQVANATVNGFEHNGRFFFEEDGHLRRLTSFELIELYRQRGYVLIQSNFANQHIGAHHWIIGLGREFIREFANPGRASNTSNRAWLLILKLRLSLLWKAKCIASFRPTNPIKSAIYPFVAPAAKLYYGSFQKSLCSEIKERFEDESGSEMLLCFRKL